MCQGSLELHVLSHMVLGPLSNVTHLTGVYQPDISNGSSQSTSNLTYSILFPEEFLRSHGESLGITYCSYSPSGNAYLGCVKASCIIRNTFSKDTSLMILYDLVL